MAFQANWCHWGYRIFNFLKYFKYHIVASRSMSQLVTTFWWLTVTEWEVGWCFSNMNAGKVVLEGELTPGLIQPRGQLTQSSRTTSNASTFWQEKQQSQVHSRRCKILSDGVPISSNHPSTIKIWSNKTDANLEDSDCTVWMLLFVSIASGPIHLRRRRIFTNFWPLPPLPFAVL